MQFLLNLPAGISFLIVTVIPTAAALARLRLVRKKYPTEVLKENHEVAAIIFNAFGLLYGVVVAFVVFVTWSGYDDATKNLQMEANEIDDIFHISKAFPAPANKIIQQGLIDYTASVYNHELNRKSEGDISVHSNVLWGRIIKIFYKMHEISICNNGFDPESSTR